MKRRLALLATVLCVIFAAPGISYAQDATLYGSVTDATNAVLPGATVTALHVDTGTQFVSVSDGSGSYRIPAMRVGVYRVTAEMSGFSTVIQENVQLLVGQTAALNLRLTLSTVQESVTVTGQAPLVDTTASALGGNIDPVQMQALPVNGRNWMALTMLAPGSRGNDISNAPVLGTSAGARTDPGYYQLNVDGFQVTQTMAGQTFGNPRYSRDAIGEFQFVSSRFDATQGRSMGVQVNAVTKSGTNSLAGSAYGSFRHDKFNAADFVAEKVLPYANQQVGGTVGGPIVMNKSHLFGYFEIEREPTTFVFIGPYPAFNIPDMSVARNEVLGGFRFDTQLTDKTRLMMRGNGWRNDLPVDIGSFGGGSRTGHPSTLGTRLYSNYQGYVSLTQLVGQGSVHEIKAGWFLTASDQYGVVEHSPQVFLRGYTLGKSAALPLRLNGHTWSIRDDFSTVLSGRGTHEIRIGGDFMWNHDFYEWQNTRDGTYDARGGPVPANLEQLFPVWNDISTWNTSALSPLAVRYTQSFGKWAWVNVTPYAGAWFQDNWTVNSNLTLNMGLRWDQAYNWSANQYDVPPLRSKAGQEWLNFGPRLGLAYSLNEKQTVLRGGWGLYYIGPKDQWSHHTPANLSYAIWSAEPDGQPGFFADPFRGRAPEFKGDANYLTCPSHPRLRCDVAGYIASDKNRVSYSHQTSVGFQQQLGATMSVQADYVWNAARREQYNQNTNVRFDPATGNNLPFSVFANRVWPELGQTLQAFSQGESNYHAIETAFTKRMSDGWQASATYTLSTFDDYIPLPTSGSTMVNFPVPTDLGDSWYPASGDQRHRAVFSSVWELPYSIQMSGLYFFGSGTSFGTSYGADLRNSGNRSFDLRPDGTIVPRGGELYGDPIHRVDLRALRRFSLGGRRTLEGSFEVFNLFNHANYGGYVGVEANPLYGKPQQNFNVAYLPRMLQLGFRFMF